MGPLDSEKLDQCATGEITKKNMESKTWRLNHVVNHVVFFMVSTDVPPVQLPAQSSSMIGERFTHPVTIAREPHPPRSLPRLLHW